MNARSNAGGHGLLTTEAASAGSRLFLSALLALSFGCGGRERPVGRVGASLDLGDSIWLVSSSATLPVPEVAWLLEDRNWENTDYEQLRSMSRLVLVQFSVRNTAGHAKSLRRGPELSDSTGSRFSPRKPSELLPEERFLRVFPQGSHPWSHRVSFPAGVDTHLGCVFVVPQTSSGFSFMARELGFFPKEVPIPLGF